jgi:hypothetical protein
MALSPSRCHHLSTHRPPLSAFRCAPDRATRLTARTEQPVPFRNVEKGQDRPFMAEQLLDELKAGSREDLVCRSTVMLE